MAVALMQISVNWTDRFVFNLYLSEHGGGLIRDLGKGFPYRTVVRIGINKVRTHPAKRIPEEPLRVEEATFSRGEEFLRDPMHFCKGGS